MDLLSTVLLALRVQSTIISNWHLGAPWGVEVSGFEPAWSINVMAGELWVESDSEPAQRLTAGDALLAPRTASCRLSSTPGAPMASLGELWRGDHFAGFDSSLTHGPLQLQWGGDGDETRLLVLAFEFQQNSPLKLLDELPALIVIRGGAADLFPSIQPAVELLKQRPGAPRPGYLAVATQLAELVFISQLRAHILTQPQQRTGWLRGLTDQRIGKALSAIHANPAHSWCVADLAREAGMSRSAFAERFALLVGRTPADYLSDWRIRLAADALRNSDDPLPVIAEKLGFESDRTFRRNFKRFMGVSPLRYRLSP